MSDMLVEEFGKGGGEERRRRRRRSRSDSPSTALDTINSEDASSQMVLANNNLTASLNTSSGTSDFQARVSSGKSSGKFYFEASYDFHANKNLDDMAIGICTSRHRFDTAFAGQDVESVGFWLNSHTYFNLNNSNTFITPNDNSMGAATGAVIGYAVDFDNKKVWANNYTTNSGWNNVTNAGGSQDPANNLGGFSFVGIGAAPWYILVDIEPTSLGQFTLNLGQKAFVGVPPSGFGLWTVNPSVQNFDNGDGGSGEWDPTIGFNSTYNSSTKKTWVGWEGSDSGASRLEKVAVFNNLTKQWGGTYTCGTRVLGPSDGHGAIVFSDFHSAGWVWGLYGTHVATDLKVTQNKYPNDPTAWTDTQTFTVATYGKITFPRGFVFGNNLDILYATGGVGIGDEEALAITTATINPATGALTGSGTKTTLLDVATAGVDGWMLPGTFLRIPGQANKLLILFTYGTFIGHYPVTNVYAVVYDRQALTLSNLAGTTSVGSGSWPLTKAQLDANFIAWSNSNCTDPSGCYDTNGNLHLLNSGGSGAAAVVQHQMWNGSVWTAPFSLWSYASGQTLPANPAVAPLANGGVRALWPDWTSSDGSFASGSGNILTASRDVSGNWSSVTTLRSQGTFGLMNPVMVPGGGPECKMLFGEVAHDGTTIVTPRRLYAIDDNGVPVSRVA